MTTDSASAPEFEPDDVTPDRRRKGFSLRSKLLLLLLAAGMTAALVMAYLGYRNGEQAISKSTFTQLTTLRSSKKSQLEWYFSNLRNTFRILGQSPAVSDALQEFQQGYFTLGLATMSDERRTNLEKFYDDTYLAKLAQTSPGKPIREVFWPRSTAGRELQSLFISENKHPIGGKDALFKPAGETVYGDSHAKFHGWFRTTQRQLKFYDIFLIDGQTGAIVYSVFKEADFGTNLLKGPYAYTNLGRLFQDVQANHRKGYVKMVDFNLYPPSYNGPAMFIGTPIYSYSGKFLGVLAAQLSIGEFSSFMGSATSLDDWGIGATGDVYLVGDDGKLRSDSRFLYKNRADFLKSLAVADYPDSDLKLIASVAKGERLARVELESFWDELRDAGVSPGSIHRIKGSATSVLRARADTDAATLAHNGLTGTKVVKSQTGVPMLSSFSPLDLPDLRWALVAEQQEWEARQPQRAFGRQVLIATSIMLLLLSLASLPLASRFLTPIRTLVDGVERVRRGDKDYKIEINRNDEFGELMEAFNRRSGEMRQMEQAVERQSEAHDTFLRTMFPDFVADRLKKGDDRIVESFHQASVIYVIIDDFASETEEMSGEQAVDVLNEIVSEFDNAGIALGIEKVKTIGDHYLAVCGMSVARLDHARRAVDFCHVISSELALFNARHETNLSLRAGIHSGPLHAGLVGDKHFVFDIWGTSLSIARRIVVDAALNTLRISTHTYHMLNRKTDFGAEIMVDTMALGQVGTYEQSLNMKVDENRLATTGNSNSTGGVVKRDKPPKVEGDGKGKRIAGQKNTKTAAE